MGVKMNPSDDESEFKFTHAEALVLASVWLAFAIVVWWLISNYL